MNAGNVQAMSAEHNFVFCATDWIGMSDGGHRRTPWSMLQDFSRFPALADRLQQGFLNFLYLGRLMIHPDGFGADPAFQDEGRSVIDTRRLFYDGNSQGGIFGGALTALAPDFTRAVLGVPGMNYSTLLRRSVDFDRYSTHPRSRHYPSELERPLILSLMQMLWDRGEPNGYAHHMTDDPLPDTPPHEVLLHVAFGDHQVANVTAEVEARTIGARPAQPALDAGPQLRQEPFYGIPPIRAFPFDGSAFVMWDTRPAAPDARAKSSAPRRRRSRTRRRARAGDPHSAPRSDVNAPHPEVRVPEDRRPRDRRLRHAPVLRRRLDRALGWPLRPPRAPTPSSRPIERSARMPASSASHGPRGRVRRVLVPERLVLGELARCASSWAGASVAGSAPKKSFSRPWSRSSANCAVGAARQSRERRAALVGELVELAPPAALLALLGHEAGGRQPLRLGVELGVLERPEVAHRQLDQPLELVRRAAPPIRGARARCTRWV